MEEMTPNTRKRRRSQKSIQTEQTILAQAKSIFSQYGFERATTRDIAQAAQVAEGTLFHHFSNKMALLEGLMVDYYSRLQTEAEKIVAGESEAAEQLRSLILAHLSWAQQDWAILRMVGQYGRYGDREFAEAFSLLNKQYTGLYTHLFDQLKETLQIRRTMPNALIRDTLFGSMEHYMISYFGHGRDYDLESFADQLLDLLFFGCGGQKG